MSNVSVAPERAARLIHVLFAIQLVSMGAMEMSGPFWPLHLKELSHSTFECDSAGVAVYVGPMLGIMLTSAFWGRVGDRTGHKLMMIRALIGLSLTQFALASASDVWSILALRFLQGACAGYIAPAQTYGVGIVDPLQRGRLFAYLQVSTNLGSLVGAVFGGIILDHSTFVWINIVAGSLCMVSALAVAGMLPDVRSTRSNTNAQREKPILERGTSPWRGTPIVGLLGVIGLLLISRMFTQTPFSLFVRTTFNVDNWVVGFCYGMLAFGFVVSAALWARFFERRKPAETMRRMTGIALGCCVLTLGAALTRSVEVFVTIHFLWGILLGATTPVLMSLVSRAASGSHQGYVLGVAQSTTQLASILGIALGGWLTHAAGLRYTYVFVGIAYALTTALILALGRERPATAYSQT